MSQKIDVAVNAPDSGTIKEFLVSEEDTVTVGQEIIRLELGGAPSGGDKQSSSGKDQSAQDSSEPKPQPKEEKQPEPKPEKKDAPSKPEPPKQPEQKKPESKSSTAAETTQSPASTSSGPGSREERRVKSQLSQEAALQKLITGIGQDEPHASPYRRASQAIPEHCGLPHYIQRGRYVQHYGVPKALQGRNS